MSGLYDLVILLDPDAPEERRTQIIEDVRAMVEAEGGNVSEQDWGTRRLAYEIDHRPEAAYHLLQFEAQPDLLDRLRHALRITDGVLRHRVIRIKPGAPTPAVPAPDAGGRREQKTGDKQVAPRAAADAPAP